MVGVAAAVVLSLLCLMQDCSINPPKTHPCFPPSGETDSGGFLLR
jgi:hypothetical protein